MNLFAVTVCSCITSELMVSEIKMLNLHYRVIIRMKRNNKCKNIDKPGFIVHMEVQFSHAVVSCWSFNGPEPGGPESTIRNSERE